MRTIRVGLGSWPAAAPFAWPFRQGMIAWPGAELAFADAAELDERMDLKTLTVALVSPESHLRNQDRWTASPKLSLSAARPDAGVAILFSRHDLALLDGTEMAVPPTAGSEPALLQALLRDRYDLVVGTVARRAPLETLLRDFPAALLIGEWALIGAQRLPEGVKAYDLGDLWREVTGSPYPVGIWAAQRIWAEDHPEAWQDAQRRLGQAKDLGLLMIDPLLEDLRRRFPLPEGVLRHHLGAYDYDAPPDFADALRRFAQLAGLPAPKDASAHDDR